MFEILQNLRESVEARSQWLTRQYPDWPCRKGCDHCCRSLAQPPELSEIEWREVRTGLDLLTPSTRAEVEARMAAPSGPPYTCAFLHPVDGACLIYAHRPIACRAYGYYVDERGIGLYCGIIREEVEAGRLQDAVWGNFSSLDSKLDELGPRLTK